MQIRIQNAASFLRPFFINRQGLLNAPGIDLRKATLRLHDDLAKLVEDADRLQVINQTIMRQQARWIGPNVEVTMTDEGPCLQTVLKEDDPIHMVSDVHFSARNVREHFRAVANHIHNMAKAIQNTANYENRTPPKHLTSRYNQTNWQPATMERDA